MRALLVRFRLCSSVLLGGVALLCDATARAQATSGPAELLFVEARALQASGRVREACEKFEASQALEPAPGTLLNLAGCYEALGKTATAWATYRQAAASAKERSKPQWAAAADEGARALEPNLARIRVIVRSQDGIALVSLDGKPLQSGALDTPLPVDPGDHVVEAHAAGRPPFQRTVRAEAGQTRDTYVVWEATKRTTPTLPPAGIPLATWFFGGASLASLAFGSVFLGLRESSASSLKEQGCSGALAADKFALCTDLRDEGKARAALEIAGFAAAGVFAATAISWAVVASKPRASSKAPVACAPALGGLACRGMF